MHKIISWFIVMFIGLVPLGAFFNAKKSPNPIIMEQPFTKREKRATSPGKYVDSCELEFASISNSFLIPSKIGGGAKIKFQDNAESPLEIKRARIFSLSLGNKNKDWINFYKNSGVKKQYDNFGYLDSDFGYEISEIIKAKITLTKSIGVSYSITSFSAEMPSLPEKENEQTLPTVITKNDGEYQYTRFQDKLDYLMIQRRDFDKFNYSYLYWVPIFNFFDDNLKYMHEISIKLNDFKQNSKFTLIRSVWPEDNLYFSYTLEFSSFNDILKIDMRFGKISFYENNDLLTKFDCPINFMHDFINTFFGQINYYGNTFHFLRYHDKLKTNFKDFMLHYQKDLTIDFINGLFNKLYKVLGEFFVQFFCASFDMDASTYVELDCKGQQQIPKNVLQMGFFYRSLITFYPKQYLINFGSTTENSKNMIFRSYFFVKDKQIANGFNTGKKVLIK